MTNILHRYRKSPSRAQGLALLIIGVVTMKEVFVTVLTTPSAIIRAPKTRRINPAMRTILWMCVRAV